MALAPIALTSPTGAQLRLAHDSTDYTDLRTGSTGNLTITPAGGAATLAGALTVSGALVAPGPNHAIGVSATVGYVGLRITNSFTSSGGSDFALGVDVDPTIVMAAGDTNYAAYLGVAGFGITTQAGETVGHVAAFRVSEPQITVGGGGSITVAASVYIGSAPTEGVRNAALYVAAGDVSLTGNQVFRADAVAHGLTSNSQVIALQTDQYLAMTAISQTEGGGAILFVGENVVTRETVTRLISQGGQAGVNKTTGSVTALVEVVVLQHNGANAAADITANGNVFAIRARRGGSVVGCFMVDEDGDMWSVTTGALFDTHDDLGLVRALELARSTDAVRQEWDQFVGYNEADLIRLNILGASVADGGMTNVTQLQRLHNGALVQLHTENRKLRGALAALLADDRDGAVKMLNG